MNPSNDKKYLIFIPNTTDTHKDYYIYTDQDKYKADAVHFKNYSITRHSS
jgi:hypothetical protein